MTQPMTERVEVSGLQVPRSIYDLVEKDIIPGTGVDKEAFWQSFASVISTFAPVNRELLAKRDSLQAQIDAWHQQHSGQPVDQKSYKAFLQEAMIFLSRQKTWIRKLLHKRVHNWLCRS